MAILSANSAAAQTPPAPVVTSPSASVLLPNYNSVPVGEMAALEGGAFVARANDTSAGFYNPAGLALAEQSAISGTAGAYQIGSVSPEALTNVKGTFQQIPAMFGVVVHDFLGRPSWAAGFTVTRAAAWDQALDSEAIRSTGGATNRLRVSTNATYDSWLASLGVGYQRSDRLRVGATVDGQYTSTSRRQSVTAQLISPTGLSAISVGTLGNMNTSHLRATLGVQFRVAPELHFGAVVRTPGLGITASGASSLEGLVRTGGAAATSEFFEPNASVEYRLPLQFNTGAAWVGTRAQVEADVFIYAGTGQYTAVDSGDPVTVVVDPGSGGAVTMSQSPYVGPRVDLRTVANFAVGGRYQLRRDRTWALHGGYATDRSPVGDTDTAFTKVNLQHVTVGVSAAGQRVPRFGGLPGTAAVEPIHRARPDRGRERLRHHVQGVQLRPGVFAGAAFLRAHMATGPEDDLTRVANPGADVTRPGEPAATHSGPDDASRPVSRGRYRLGARLGEGGMAIVVEAEDVHLKRPVAIKQLRDGLRNDASARGRFFAEAEILAGLNHAGVVSVHEAGLLDDGGPFYAMARVKGSTLADLLIGDPGAGYRLSLRLVEIVQRAAETMGHAHARGLIHLDLKPHNIMVDEDGAVYVMDWGIAQRVGAVSGSERGVVAGTPAYMSPEVASGRADLATPRSDVFALGVILYEVLTGRRPFTGDSAQILKAVKWVPARAAPRGRARAAGAVGDLHEGDGHRSREALCHRARAGQRRPRLPKLPADQRGPADASRPRRQLDAAAPAGHDRDGHGRRGAGGVRRHPRLPRRRRRGAPRVAVDGVHGDLVGCRQAGGAAGGARPSSPPAGAPASITPRRELARPSSTSGSSCGPTTLARSPPRRWA